MSKEVRDTLDGLFRLGFNLLESDNYSEALVLYNELLKRDDIKGFNRAECLLRRGIAKTKGQITALPRKILRALYSILIRPVKATSWAMT